jgi:methylated-DNA-protein-cysteine methyltransferase related protein
MIRKSSPRAVRYDGFDAPPLSPAPAPRPSRPTARKAKPAKAGAGTKPSARAPLTERILTAIRSIPKGRVASYGQVAAAAGSPRGARQVARLLHSLSEKEKLPWHRVINSAGRISLPIPGAGVRQAALLRKEKVEVSETGAIHMERFGWKTGKRSG